MELRLNSPAGGDPAVFQWPLITAVSHGLYSSAILRTEINLRFKNAVYLTIPSVYTRVLGGGFVALTV